VVLTALSLPRGFLPIRYGTNDVAAWLTDEPCACGRTSSRLGPVIGRRDHQLKIRGQTIFPELLLQVVDESGLAKRAAIGIRKNALQADEATILVVPMSGVSGDEVVQRVRATLTRHVPVLPAVSIVEEHALRELEEIVIRSAGCAAITTAWVCRTLKIPAEAVIPRRSKDEVGGVLTRLGAVVHQLDPEQAAQYVQVCAADPRAHVVDQFRDRRIVDYYRPMSREILAERRDVAAIVVGIGTAACIMGVAHEVRAQGAGCRVIGVWPAEFDPSWRTPYRVHGISGLAPPVRETHLERERIDEIVMVPSADAVVRARQIFDRSGLPPRRERAEHPREGPRRAIARGRRRRRSLSRRPRAGGETLRRRRARRGRPQLERDPGAEEPYLSHNAPRVLGAPARRSPLSRGHGAQSLRGRPQRRCRGWSWRAGRRQGVASVGQYFARSSGVSVSCGSGWNAMMLWITFGYCTAGATPTFQ
jgi:hypothetical protein